MTIKGFDDLEPLGCIEIDKDCSYFYYLIPAEATDSGPSLLELEVIFDSDGQQFSRRVTSFITDPDLVRDLLAM